MLLINRGYNANFFTEFLYYGDHYIGVNLPWVQISSLENSLAPGILGAIQNGRPAVIYKKKLYYIIMYYLGTQSHHDSLRDVVNIEVQQLTPISTVSELRHENSLILISHTSGRLSDKLFTEIACGYRNALPNTCLALLLCTLNSKNIMSINC